MADQAGIEAVGEGVVEAAEHHTTTGQGLNWRQTETLGHAAGPPVIRRVVQHHRGAVEQAHQVLHPALLHLHAQPPPPQGRHQLLQHVAAALALLHQHVNRAAQLLAVSAGAPLEPHRFQGIGHQKQGIAGCPVTPVAQGVAAHRQHRYPGRQIEAVATAVGVIHRRSTAQATQQPGHIKAPADDPQSRARRRLAPEQIIKKRMALLTLAIGDHLGMTQGTHQPGALQLHQQSAAAETSAGAGNEETDGAQAQAATASVLPARWRRVRKPKSTLPMAAIRLPSNSWNISMLQWKAWFASSTMRSAMG